MIRKFIDRLFRRNSTAGSAAAAPAPSRAPAPASADKPRPARGKPAAAAPTREAVSYDGTELGMQLADVSDAAIRTCETLQKAGFKAFIVGGGVRDLLLGLKPKDFDVATDAVPDQVTKLFRRSRVIGRRFQIVHVMFGRETIEVSTFRALRDEKQSDTDEHGRVLRDNVWGTQAEDAARRDFTINALYYDPVADVVLDWHDGVRDLKQRVLRMIGDPALRYREDPVRMLRTARFAGKTAFEVEEATRAPIRELASLVNNVPPARLFDEMLKLLQSGHALDSLRALRAEGLHHGLLPLLDVILEQPGGERFLTVALTRTDERVQAGKSVSPGFLFAALLWKQVRMRWDQRVQDGEPSIVALHAAIDTVLAEQSGKLAIQKRIISDMREIWALQPRFERRSGAAPFRLLEHIRFRAGYDFLILRCDADDAPAELGAWWTSFIDADGPARKELVAKAPSGNQARKRKRRPSRSRKRTDSNGAAGAGEAAGPAPAAPAPNDPA